MQTSRITLITAALLVMSFAPAAMAQGAPTGVGRTDLLRRDLSTPQIEVIQVRVDFAPGATAPRHSHPGEEIAYAIEGVMEYQLEGQPPVTLRPGQVLFIPPGTIHSVKNLSGAPAAELATYIVKKGEPLLVLAQ